MLRDVENLPYEKLRPLFRDQVENLIQSVLKNVRQKIINNYPINGENFSDLICFYVEALNSHALPNINSAWERIIEKEYTKILEKAQTRLGERLKSDVFNKKL